MDINSDGLVWTDTLVDLAYFVLDGIDSWLLESLGVDRVDDSVVLDDSLDEHPLIVAEKRRQLESLDPSTSVEKLAQLATIDVFSRE